PPRRRRRHPPGAGAAGRAQARRRVRGPAGRGRTRPPERLVTRPFPWGKLSVACLLAFLAVTFTLGLTLDADLETLGTVSEWRSPCLTLLMQGVSLLGSGVVQAPFAAGAVGVLIWRGRKTQAAGYMAWLLVGWAVYGLLKVAVHRTRPSLVERLSDGGW